MATTEPTGIEPCPYCGGSSGVQQITGTPPTVQGWSCGTCGTDWWISVVNPRQRYLERLTESVQLQVAQLALREIITLVDEAPTLSDDHLRARRLVNLATAARPGCRCD